MRSAAVVLALACALVLAAAATAGGGDPQRRIAKADQADARAMLLRKADLVAGFTVEPPSKDDDLDFSCDALDESDLTLTGDAESPGFSLQRNGAVLFVSSTAQVYRTEAQASASWRRGTSAAGVRCVAAALRKLGAREASAPKLRWLKRVPAPNVSGRTAAFRGRFDVSTAGRTAALHFHVVVLQRGRSLAGLVFVAFPTAVAQAEQLALARVVAARMAATRAGGRASAATA